MVEVRWLNDAEQAMWRGYLESSRLLFRSLDRQLVRDAGISLADYEILVVLSEAPGRCLRMHEVADAMSATRGGATRAVSRLVESGWVRRVDCRDDKRGALAELTDAGAGKLADAAPGHTAAVRKHMIDLFSAADVDLFARRYAEMVEQLRIGGDG
jgi:DNA-binding MarR family transcriptional regulator